MSKSKLTVQDRGFDQLFPGLRSLARGSAQVGVDDEQAARYAPFIEAEHAPFRDAMDAKRQLAPVVEQATAGQSREALEAFAKELADDVKKNLEERGLVDTGRLRDSVRGVAR